MSTTSTQSRKRLVLADDHPIFLDGLQRLLQVEYSVVATLGRGDDFVAEVVANQPDLIIADDTLPQLADFTALDSFDSAGVSAKFVLLTRNEDEEHAVSALRRGIDAYVLKRAASTELLSAVRAAFAGERWISPGLAVRIIQKLHDQPVRPNEEIAAQLSERQRTIIARLVRGQIAKEIAADLGISRKTVEYHKYKLMDQFGFKSTANLIRFAVKNGLDVLEEETVE